MDLGKRKFLQNLGVLTAGTALVPMAEAGLHFRRPAVKATRQSATVC